MKLGKVIGNVVSTIKTKSHHHLKLMVVNSVDQDRQLVGDSFIAIDHAQAGIGDFVLVMEEGGAARKLLDNPKIAVDAIIIGVIDEI